MRAKMKAARVSSPTLTLIATLLVSLSAWGCFPGPWSQEKEPLPDLSDVEAVPRTVSWQGEALEANVATVAVDFFQERNARPAFGRAFIDGDESVVMLSYELWERTMSGDPDVLGGEISVGDETYTIVGVLPEKVSPRIDLFEHRLQ